MQRGDGYPPSIRALDGTEDRSRRPELFDPALKQWSRAFRLGDPEFTDVEQARAWYALRRQVMGHVLRLLVLSEFHNHLVLRGSLLMETWFGERSREPGDLDFVYRPVNVHSDSQEAQTLERALRRWLVQQPVVGNATIRYYRVTTEDIWTYERASGRRIVVPWESPGLPPGTVQVDIVYGENLYQEPIRSLVPTTDGESVELWTASPEMSLCWKVLWLETDSYPQGKDLYDACLLTERILPSRDLLEEVVGGSPHTYDWELKPDFPLRWHVDWELFQTEYPWIRGSTRDWQLALSNAFAPLFESE